MRKRRKLLGLSQAALARKADTSTNFIAMIELCRKFPSPETLGVIADALGVEAQELFSQPPSPQGALRELKRDFLTSLQPALRSAVAAAVMEAVDTALDSTLDATLSAHLDAHLHKLEAEGESKRG
jgi:transcriptional regulator with XRE-family HTH domain